MATEITYRIDNASGTVENLTRTFDVPVTVNVTARVSGQVTQDLTFRITDPVVFIGPFAKLLLENGLDCLLLENGNRLRIE